MDAGAICTFVHIVAPRLKARGYAKGKLHDGEGRVRYSRRYAPRLGCVCGVWTKDRDLDAGPIVQAAPCIALQVQCSGMVCQRWILFGAEKGKISSFCGEDDKLKMKISG